MLGHEAAGRDRRGRRRGDPGWPSGSGCRSSPACRAAPARSAWPGATTCARTCGSSPPRRSTARSPSYVVVHQAFAHPVPDSMSDDAAALLEPLSVGVWALPQGRVGPGLPGAGHRRRADRAGRRADRAGPSGPARSWSPTSTRAGWRWPARSARPTTGRRALGVESPALGRRRAARVLRAPAGHREGIRALARAGVRCWSAWAATRSRCRCPRCRTASSRSPAPSATPTPGRPRSRWWRPAGWTSTGSSPATTTWPTPRSR